MAQERVSIAQLPTYLSDQMKAWETPAD